MSLAIFASTLQALRSFKEHPYVRYIGISLANISNPPNEYRAIVEKKTRLQLLRITAAVCGIELCYAAETAFVSPILLKLGVPVMYMTLVWCLSPLLGFFLVPLLGSLSDRCRSRLGRRRPFILLLSIGIVVGLVLVPNGDFIGRVLGDVGLDVFPNVTYPNGTRLWMMTQTTETLPFQITTTTMELISSNVEVTDQDDSLRRARNHLKGIILTILGVALLDFDCDACQSPCRAYLLDISIPEDHNSGLATFTVMAGLGGSIGYMLGGIDWNATHFGAAFGGHVRIVFTSVLLVFLICLMFTLTSFREIPLEAKENQLQSHSKKVGKSKYRKFENESDDDDEKESDVKLVPNYGSLGEKLNILSPSGEDSTRENKEDHDLEKSPNPGTDGNISDPVIIVSADVTLKTYLWSIVHMPKSIFILCLTNLFCWMSLVCYSLYFTDFVGQAVYDGDPSAPSGSFLHNRYDEGVRLGSFAMSLYSLSCAIYSFAIEKLMKRFKAKNVYICGQLTYTVGMAILAATKNKIAVVLLSPTAGIMYATLFTMPYLLVAHYHTKGEFGKMDTSEDTPKQVRGLGTDVALVSSMVFVAQFLLSLGMGSVIHLSGTTVVVVVAAAVLSFCGAITATQVVYLDL